MAKPITWKTIASPSFNASAIGTAVNAFTNSSEGFRDTAANLFALRDQENEFITNQEVARALRTGQVGNLNPRTDAATVWEAVLGRRKADDDSQKSRATSRNTKAQAIGQENINSTYDIDRLFQQKIDRGNLETNKAQVEATRARTGVLQTQAEIEEEKLNMMQQGQAASSGVDAYLENTRQSYEQQLFTERMPAFREVLNGLDISDEEKEQRLYDFQQILQEESRARVAENQDVLIPQFLADNGYSLAQTQGSQAYATNAALLEAAAERATAQQGLNSKQNERFVSVYTQAAEGQNIANVRVDPETGAFSPSASNDEKRTVGSGEVKPFLQNIIKGFDPDEGDVEQAKRVVNLLSGNAEAFEFVLRDSVRKGLFGGRSVDWEQVLDAASQLRIGAQGWGREKLEALSTGGPAPLTSLDAITRLRRDERDQSAPPRQEAPVAGEMTIQDASDYWDKINSLK